MYIVQNGQIIRPPSPNGKKPKSILKKKKRSRKQRKYNYTQICKNALIVMLVMYLCYAIACRQFKIRF